MIIDLTTNVTTNSPLIAKAKSQESIPVAMGHVGTHLDTHEKTTIPLEYFKSRGIVFQVLGVQEICSSHIDINRIEKNDFVLFNTGQIERFGYGEKEYFQNHPQLSVELILLLISRKIRFIGVDAPGIRTGLEHGEADRLCETNGIYVVENLCNLNKLSNGSTLTIYTMWLDDENMTGLRCRVLAEIY